MAHLPKLIGVVIGLCLAAGVTAMTERGWPSAESATGPLLSECDGAIRELVIQYTSEAAPIVERTYRDFLAQLPADVTVRVVCPNREAFDDFLRRTGRVSCTLRPIIAGHAMTCWARDRWIALAPERSKGPMTLLLPRAESGADLWPQRAGDERTGLDVASSAEGSVVANRSALLFDGGDFTTDGQIVFVTPDVARRNVQHTVKTREELVATLERILKRKVALLDPAPDHHAGMFMMVAGNRTALVGDPRLAKSLMAEETMGELLSSAGGCDFSEETQRRFDAVASQCEKLGYRVVRMPTIPAADGRTYLTYVNAIIDQRSSGRIAYMPTFQGAEPLNRAAADVWRRLGYEVRPVDCTATYRHFGCLHCLVNVLRRS